MDDNPFLDSEEEVIATERGFLPHWTQNGKLVFVTFRLADSLPQSRIRELSDIKRRFLEKHPLPWADEVKIEFRKIIGPLESRLLDLGYGSCILAEPTVRSIVSGTLKYNDGKKYEILAYVIMPNHVHLLLRLADGVSINSVMQSIKGYSARIINRTTGHTGSVWMSEYFDKIIRGERHLSATIDYILRNPRHLPPDRYELYVK